VVEAYRKEGAGLVVRVCNGQGVLEEMTGLAQMRREADAMDILWVDEEEEEEEEEDEEEGVELDLGMGGMTIDGGGSKEEGEGNKEEETKQNGGDAGGGNGGGNATGETEDAAVVAWRKRIS